MMEEFIKYLKRDRKSEKTISLYKKVIEEFQDWYVVNNNGKSSRFKKSDIVKFAQYLEKDKHSKPSTIKLKTCILMKFCAFLLFYCT